MKNHIAEDLPARQFAAITNKSNTLKGNTTKKPSTNPALQTVYDIRYEFNNSSENITLRQVYDRVMKTSKLGRAERLIVQQKLFGKGGGGMKAENFNSIFKNAAADSISNALYQVFVEKLEVDADKLNTELTEFYTKLNKSGDLIYHIRVTDKRTGDSYTRDASREKMDELRKNTDLSIEMSEIDLSRKKEKPAGKGLDPVGKEDGDVDNDGDKDKSDKYLLKRRGAIGDAIATRKEDFIHEAGKKKEPNKFDIMPKGKKNSVTVGPDMGPKKGLMAHNELKGNLIYETGYSKFLNKITTLHEKAVSQNQQQLAAMALKYLKGDMPDASKEIIEMSKMGEKKLREFAKTSHEGLPEKVKEEMNCDDEPDMRPLKTKINLEKTKLRLMGAKNPIVMMMPSQDSPNS